MAYALNLDALILREDFEVEVNKPPASSQLAPGVKVNELEENSMTYLALRKPDFQRETADWQPEMVVDLVKSFLDGDLIPSVILWRSPSSGNIFVIDGSHRLSALIAWVQDDYGDGRKSVEFFENIIPREQASAADKCRTLIKKTVGTYEEVKAALLKPGNAPQERILRARNMAAFSIQLQWVVGDAKTAEASFFKINQKATPINQVELLMLQSRRKPNAIASRALIRAGVGHKYWAKFSDEKQREIEKLAREIYDTLFVPALETPIKTLDLPIAGRGYSAESVKLIFEFMNFANKVNLKKKNAIAELTDDLDGSATVQYLVAVKRLAQLIAGKDPSSLGLHPAVYFYGATGRYQSWAFLATISFVDDLDQHQQLPRFTSVRSKFEEVLVRNPQFINQIVNQYGSSSTSMASIVDMYKGIFAGVLANKSDQGILVELKKNPRLDSLSEITEEDKRLGKNFSTDTKNRVFLREAISTALRCGICDSRVHRNAITIDHIVPMRERGSGNASNAQLAHPYCNSARDAIEAFVSSSGASETAPALLPF
ncbi:MAG: DUF262 domain-containing protein [Candidatus Binatia bacterium]